MHRKRYLPFPRARTPSGSAFTRGPEIKRECTGEKVSPPWRRLDSDEADGIVTFRLDLLVLEQRGA